MCQLVGFDSRDCIDSGMVGLRLVCAGRTCRRCASVRLALQCMGVIRSWRLILPRKIRA